MEKLMDSEEGTQQDNFTERLKHLHRGAVFDVGCGTFLLQDYSLGRPFGTKGILHAFRAYKNGGEIYGDYIITGESNEAGSNLNDIYLWRKRDGKVFSLIDQGILVNGSRHEKLREQNGAFHKFYINHINSKSVNFSSSSVDLSEILD